MTVFSLRIDINFIFFWKEVFLCFTLKPFYNAYRLLYADTFSELFWHLVLRSSLILHPPRCSINIILNIYSKYIISSFERDLCSLKFHQIQELQRMIVKNNEFVWSRYPMLLRICVLYKVCNDLWSKMCLDFSSIALVFGSFALMWFICGFQQSLWSNIPPRNVFLQALIYVA